MKGAAELVAPDAGELFELALQSIARPAPAIPESPIIVASKAGKKKPARKSGSTD